MNRSAGPIRRRVLDFHCVDTTLTAMQWLRESNAVVVGYCRRTTQRPRLRGPNSPAGVLAGPDREHGVGRYPGGGDSIRAPASVLSEPVPKPDTPPPCSRPR